MAGLDALLNKDNEKVITEFLDAVARLNDNMNNNMNDLVSKQNRALIIPKAKKADFETMLEQFQKVQKLRDGEKINSILKETEGENEFWEAIIEYLGFNSKVKKEISPVMEYEYDDYERICIDFFENNVKYNGVSELEEKLHYNKTAFIRLFKMAEEHIIVNRETKELFQNTMKKQLELDNDRANVLWELFDGNRDELVRYKILEYLSSLHNILKSS